MASRKGGLGRGLESLFNDQPSVATEESAEAVEKKDDVNNAVVYIDINDIAPNRNQPRKTFDQEKIAELANSISEHGIIQPLIVREISTGYEIVAGERRWRAAREAKLKKVPCIVREFTDEENMLIAIIENMQREDLNPIEEAEGLNQMIKTYGLTQEEVSRSVSKSRPYITNSLRLLRLPGEIRDLVSEGKITTGHARAIVNVDSKKEQADICAKIIEEGLSVRAVEKMVKEGKKEPAQRRKKVKSHQIISVENHLKDIFGTKVNINQKGKKGKIEIEYYSTEELNRLLEMLEIEG